MNERTQEFAGVWRSLDDFEPSEPDPLRQPSENR